jgi:enoyl-[acyl-carrier-protein] reductase (NADH)
VSNVAFAKIVRDLQDLKRNALDLSLAYSAWPIVDLVQAAQEELGALPRYVVGVSSDGASVCHPGYDLAGASKAVLETLCRYLAVRLRASGVRVNAVRPGLLDTQSSRAMLGDAAMDRLRQRVPSPVLDLAGVARACVALCSGLLDSVTGQVLVVDEGWSLVDPLDWNSGPEGDR